ncbi:NAD(P)H-dependent flavin oxidoreductase [Thermodesulfobacteriota bacterium]
MKHTRVCDIFGIEYPIILAPMGWIGSAELAAAVSEAGGLGTIGPNAGMQEQREAGDMDASMQRFREQIRKARELTDKPFAANITVGLGKQRAITDKLVDVALAEKLPIAVVSMGSSKAYTARLKQGGIKVIHAVGSIDHARKAEADGVDAVVCEGYEAGGHLGGEELTLFVLIPQITDAVDLPVISAGGIVDERGVAAAFALGAEAVYMGTRFMAADECPAHPRVKQAILEATDTSTVAFGRKTGISRCLKNEYTRKHQEIEASGATFEEIRNYERTCPTLGGWRRFPGAFIAGHIEEGSVAMGSGAGIIKEIIPAGEIVRRIVEDYKAVIDRIK